VYHCDQHIDADYVYLPEFLAEFSFEQAYDKMEQMWKNKPKGDRKYGMWFESYLYQHDMSDGFFDCDNIGRRSIVDRFVDNLFNPDRTTLPEDHFGKTHRGVLFRGMLEAGGGEEYHSLWIHNMQYIPNLLFFDDFVAQDSFENLVNLIKRISEARKKHELRVVVIRSKSDLNCSFPNKRLVLEFCRRNNLPFICASGKTGINCIELFEIVFRLHVWGREWDEFLH
jgi:hypothetical protein